LPPIPGRRRPETGHRETILTAPGELRLIGRGRFRDPVTAYVVVFPFPGESVKAFFINQLNTCITLKINDFIKEQKPEN
jgi:hypothetical protein